MVLLIALLAKREKYKHLIEKYKMTDLFVERKKKRYLDPTNLTFRLSSTIRTRLEE